MLGGAILIIVLGATPALAGSVVKAFDRSDNDFSFTYSPEGRMRAAISSAVFRRGDKVSFFAYVRERGADAPEGRRLAGVLELTLARPRAPCTMRAGSRSSSEGSAVQTTERRPSGARPLAASRFARGDRREVMRFRFDLERGRYVAFGRFRALDD